MSLSGICPRVLWIRSEPHHLPKDPFYRHRCRLVIGSQSANSNTPVHKKCLFCRTCLRTGSLQGIFVVFVRNQIGVKLNRYQRFTVNSTHLNFTRQLYSQEGTYKRIQTSQRIRVWSRCFYSLCGCLHSGLTTSMIKHLTIRGSCHKKGFVITDRGTPRQLTK